MKNRKALLSEEKVQSAIIKLAVPAIIALLVKAFYNIVDTFYIGMLNSEISLAAVGVTLPIILISSSIENIFASGCSVLVGRYLGENQKEKAEEVLSTTLFISTIIAFVFAIVGIVFIEDILKLFGATKPILKESKDYAFFMFISIIANLPSECLNASARAESSVKITTIAVSIGAALNVILDPIFMFSFGLNLGVKGASIATTISQFVTLFVLLNYYFRKKSIININFKKININKNLLKNIIIIGIPTAIMQISVALSTSLTNISISKLKDSYFIIASYGIVQRLIVIGLFIILGFMQGYQPIISYSYGAKNKNRFKESFNFALKSTVILSLLISVFFILFSKNLIRIFNNNEKIIEYGSKLLISQSIFYISFGISYMMTVTLQVLEKAKLGMLLSIVRQGIFYPIIIMNLPKILGLKGLYFSQPLADILTFIVIIIVGIKINKENYNFEKL